MAQKVEMGSGFAGVVSMVMGGSTAWMGTLAGASAVAMVGATMLVTGVGVIALAVTVPFAGRHFLKWRKAKKARKGNL